MFTPLLPEPPAAANPEAETRSDVLARLLDEAERGAARERKAAPRPRPPAAPAPRPFAFD
jgi:hypothetical protein